MDYYTLNLPKCKKKIDSFLLSQKFLKLPRRWQSVTECIFRTILASPNLYCNKSNRTICVETGVSIHVINQVRLWLESEGVVSILRLRNGKRVNPRFLIQMSCVGDEKLEISKMTWDEKERYSAIMGLSMDELSQAKLTDLKNFNLHHLAKTELQKETEEIENRSVYDIGINDLNIFDNPGTKNSLEELSNICDCGSAEKEEKNLPIECNLQAFETLNMHVKAEVLESNGFMTVPTKGKEVYCGYDSLIGKGKEGRLDLIGRISMAKDFTFSSDFYRERMGVEAYDTFRQYTFGKSAWVNRIKFMGKKFDHYQKYDSLAVVMKKGMVTIDIDSKDYYYLAVLKNILPDCLIQETPRGFHVFVRDSFNTLAEYKKLGQNVDIKHYRSHVVVSGTGYRFIQGSFDNLVNLPEDFVSRIANALHLDREELKSPEIDAKNSLNILEYTSSSDFEPKKNGKFQLPDFLEVGERNYTCMRYSFYLRAKGYTVDSIEKILRDYIFDRKRVQEPLKESEIRGIIRHLPRKKNKKDFIQWVPMFSVEIS